MRPLFLGALLAALVGVSSADGRTVVATRANLEIASDRPLVVLGKGFRPRERVRLLTSPRASIRKVTAGPRGRFRAVVADSAPACGGVVVQAFGNMGSRAMVDRTGPDCAPVD
jgi:hypothetical protein